MSEQNYKWDPYYLHGKYCKQDKLFARFENLAPQALKSLDEINEWFRC